MRPRASRPSASPTASSSASTALPARRAIAVPRAKCASATLELAEEELRPADEQQHLQPRAELLVVEGRDRRRRLTAERPRLRVLLERVGGHRERGGRGGRRHRVDGARQRLARARAHLQRVPAQRRVRGELQVERDRRPRVGRRPARSAAAAGRRRGRRAAGPSSRRRRSAPVAPARPRAAGRAARAARGARRRSGPHPPARRASGPSSAHSCGPRASERATVSQCTAVCGARAPTSAAACARTATAAPSPRRGGLLDVMGERDRSRAVALEPRRGARVPGEPPARPDRLVDRAAHDRMAEAEAPHVLGAAHEVGGDEHVQRLQRGRRARARRPRRRSRSRTGRRRSPRRPAARARRRRAAWSRSAPPRGRASGTSPCPGSLGARRPRARLGARELHQVERVAAALRVQPPQLPVVGGRASSRDASSGGERRERQPAAPGRRRPRGAARGPARSRPGDAGARAPAATAAAGGARSRRRARSRPGRPSAGRRAPA